MNSFFFSTNTLLTGQAAPFTGAAIDTSKARNCLFTVSGNGVGAVYLQYLSPFANTDWITFQSVTGLTTGFASPIFSDSPMPQIRALSSGVGSFWAGSYQQN